MTAKTILSIGQCRPDTAAITQFLKSNFDCEVVSTDLPDDSMDVLRSRAIDLVLINRKLDADYSEGMDILNSIKADAALSAIPVMLVSNFPESQEQAVSAGAVYGFGKAELNLPESVEKVREALAGE